MNTLKLSNISLSDFRTFLFEVGCTRVSTEGGHEKWTKQGLTRPVTLQTHIDSVPRLTAVIHASPYTLDYTALSYWQSCIVLVS